MNVAELREEALAQNQKGLDIYKQIAAGELGIEKREEADALIKEAGEKMQLAESGKRALAQNAALTEGLGSLTAGTSEDEPREEKSEPAWDSPLQWLMAITASGVPKHKAALLQQGVIPDDFEQKLLQEAVGASGGFLVPVEYRPELFAKPAEAAIVRPRATVIPMSVTQVQMPSLDQTITPDNAKSAYFAGINFEWIEESEEKPEIDFKFKLIDLITHELAGWIPVSNRLIAHSAISLDALIRQLFGKAMSDAEDWWFINGDGVGKPQGVISAPCTIQPNRAGAGAIVFSDIEEIVHAYQPDPRGVWLAHICTMEQIMELKDGNSNYMWIPNMRDGMPERLMGYPLIFTEKVPNLGTKGDIGLYNFSYYLVGDGEGPSIESSIHERFRKNQTTYRISELVDGKPWLSAPVMMRPDGTTSISPFVSLDVPA
ncbi:MAG: phage major capsid protein [Promethearchaeota archaeon]